MKKLLGLAAAGLVGYYAVKKIKERKEHDKVLRRCADKLRHEAYEKCYKNNDEIAIDEDETVQVEDVEVVDEEKVNIVDGIKNMFRKPIKSIIKICVKTGYVLCKILDKIRIRIVKLTNSERYETISNFEYNGLMYNIEYYCKIIELYICQFIYTGVKGLMVFIIFICKNIADLNNNI